jgi:ankyrin repeat protein
VFDNYNSILRDRNIAWIPEIEKYIKQEGTTLVIAGTNHFFGEHSVLKLLEQKGYEIEQLYHTEIPLNVAASLGETERVKELLVKDTDVDIKDGDGMTALHYAVDKGHKEVAELLIAAGADLNTQDNYGKAPLHYAAAQFAEEICEALIAAGADVNLRDNLGFTPLDYSWSFGIIEDSGGKTSSELRAEESIHGAVEQGNIEWIKQHLVNGADVNDVNDFGRTALHYINNIRVRDEVGFYHPAASAEMTVIVFNILMDEGADLNAKDIDNSTPLHFASYIGQYNVAKLLITNGANINSKDRLEAAPLHIAVKFGQKRIVELLIDAGADFNAKDKYGKAPLHVASEEGKLSVVVLFHIYL